MQYYDSSELIYSEMFEGEDGTFRSVEGTIFSTQEYMRITAERLPPLQAAADLWACWMRSEGYNVFKLPRTTRVRDWGLTYSVTALGEESRLYLVTLEF